MPNIKRAQSASEGFIVDEENNGPFFTGGVASPVGLGLPFNTVYLQTLAGGHFIWKKVGGGDTASDWRKYSSQDIPFDGGNFYRDSVTDVKQALNDLRSNIIHNFKTLTSALNTTDSLVVGDQSLTIVEGTATGYNVKLPDATTLKVGTQFRIGNLSTEQIGVQDGSGAAQLSVPPENRLQAILRDNGTVAGEWVISLISITATGILSFFVETETLFSTGSDTDVMITGMEITPVDGRYAVWFSADTKIETNNRIAEVVIYSDGVADERTRRSTQGLSVNFLGSAQSLGIISVSGSETIDIRTNVTGGTVEFTGRSMLLVRLGASA